ncbi:unnamed protein product [Soboliphyme baturini]|uniref:Endoplasmic reticulum junction formation protein lunapark n=1 Tax=Soboliphyme baturini TaxID=241478 RepID=A0A183ICT1_9BILA|nr:unnamed protein product [Soboliphyme baturini]
MRWLRFLKSEPSYSERLRRIEVELVNTEHSLKSILYDKKRFFGYTCIVTGFTFTCIAIYAYFSLLPPKLGDLCLWLMVVAFCMTFFYLMKVMFSWYFSQRVEWYQLHLETLKQERIDLLQEVREKETYHVAKDLIDRFDPEGTTTSALAAGAATDLNDCDSTTGGFIRSTSRYPSFVTPDSLLTGLKQQRSVVDKIVDFFLNDGPNNRYALICSVCCGHNGTVPKDQIAATAFRCCYCFAFNPAPKVADQNSESLDVRLFQDCGTQTDLEDTEGIDS